MKKLLTLLLLAATIAQAQISPVKYYYFSSNLADSASTGQLTTTGSYSYTAGQVGNCISLTSASRAFRGSTLTPSSGWSVQFAYKPSYNFDKYLNASIIHVGNWEVSIAFDNVYKQPYIGVRPSTSTSSSLWAKLLNGIGINNYSAWNDTNWHVMAVTYSNATGLLKIYLNGKSHNTFEKTISGTADAGQVSLNIDLTNYLYEGKLDEVAFYNAPLDPRQVAQNYTDFTNGRHYTSTYGTAQTGTVRAALDTNYYGYGHVLGTQPTVDYIQLCLPATYAFGSTTANDYTQTCLTQLQSYQVPRYLPSNTFQRNFNWLAPDYMAGRGQTGTNTTNINLSYTIQDELIKRWNYGVLAIENAVSTDTLWFNRWITLANENYNIRTDVITNYAQQGGNLTKQGFTSTNYVRDGSGAFLSPSGPSSNPKYLDIYSPCAVIDSLKSDARYIAQIFRNRYMSKFTLANIDLISENNEIIPVYYDTLKVIGSSIQAAKVSSGKTWRVFLGDGYKRGHQYYVDSIVAVTSAKLQIYSQDGYEEYRAKWTSMRGLQSTMNGYKYSTPDIYFRWASNWRFFTCAWHGLNWANVGRVAEMKAGDTLFSPFVSAGWSTNPEDDMNPPQYLGLLKVISGMGAEFFYSAYFSIDPYPAPKGWAWQAVMPSYVQAANTRVPDFLTSYTLRGNVKQWDAQIPDTLGLLQYTGNKRIACTVRKVKTRNCYAIYSNINGVTNQQGEVEDSAYVQLKIGSDTIYFYTRPQGSIYVWEKDTNVFYQVDGWHERKHPSRWSTDYYMENEVADNYVRKVTDSVNKNFVNFTTHIYLNPIDTAKYTFFPRPNARYYVWFRLKSSSGGTLSIKSTSGTQTISCIGSSWAWINKCSGAKIRLLASDTGTFRLYASTANILIDKMYFTTDSTFSFGGLPTPPTPTITAVTPFCTTTSLTASTHTSYLWNTGATTQSVTASATATYTVTVTDAYGQTGSATKYVIKASMTTVTITGTTSACPGDSTQISAGTHDSYLWNNGKTTSSIYGHPSTTYTVTVTDDVCTRSTSVTITTATITASITGASEVCPDDSTLLDAGTHDTYLWSNGYTTQTAWAEIGTYTVTVSDGLCTTTATKSVQESAGTSVTITGGTTVCYQDSTLLDAGTHTSYLWSTGASTQTIYVQAGEYAVEVNDGTCTATSSVIVTQASQNTPAISADTICGSPISISADGGVSWWWSTGASTQSATVSSRGTYTVTVTYSDGCTSTATKTVIECSVCSPTNLVATNVQVNGQTKIRLTWSCNKQPLKFRIEVTRPDGTVKYRNVQAINSYTFNWCANKQYKFRVQGISQTQQSAWSNYALNQRCNQSMMDDCE